MAIEEAERCEEKTNWVPERPTLLLVEGKDDKAFFEALIKHMNLDNIQVIQLEGKTKWKDKVKTIKDRAEFQKIVISLGLVRDANENPNSTFQSVCDALDHADLPVPDKPLVTVGARPKVTVLILPKENESGELEDLCLESVEDDPAIPCVKEYFHCLEQKNLSLPNKLCKPKVQVFLASKPNIISGFREAAKAGCWPLDDAAFEIVKYFLRQICE